MKVTIEGVEYVPAPFRPDDVLPMHRLFAQARKNCASKMREVSAGAGVSMNAISRAESGDFVSLLTAIKLCRYYGIELETLADSVDTHGIPNAVPRTPTKRKAARMGGRA